MLNKKYKMEAATARCSQKKVFWDLQSKSLKITYEEFDF